jgi:hypothetical protein
LLKWLNCRPDLTQKMDILKESEIQENEPMSAKPNGKQGLHLVALYLMLGE